MKILFLASEVTPFSKTGGLADVAGALPASLARLGHEVTVVTPYYAYVRDRRIHSLDLQVRLKFPFGEEVGSLYEAQLEPRCRVLFIRHAGYFGRPGLYQENGVDYPDNDRRFAFFTVAALAAAERLDFIPQIVHLNDWQTGLGSLALRRGYRDTALRDARSLFTIHNLAYQGNFPRGTLQSLGLARSDFTIEGLEFHDRVSFMKAGLVYSDAITTVSRRYAQEIQTADYGFGMDGVLRSVVDRLHGVLNGVDYGEWDPAHDPHLPRPFGPDDLLGKAASKALLLQRFGLGGDGEDRPLFGVVSRLAHQKGLDLLLAVAPDLLERGASLVLLGNGDGGLEDGFRQLAVQHPGRVGVRIGFDLPLSHLIEAGSDFFLMPSRFEPSGLNQMYSLRYGAIPIVRATGGLDDTVEGLGSPAANGIKFREFTPEALLEAIESALGIYAQPKRLESLRRRGMRCDFSWDASARQYEAIYRSIAVPPGEETPLPRTVVRGP